MRGRLLFALFATTIVVAMGIAAVTIGGSAGSERARSTVVAVDVTSLRPGRVTSIEASLPHHPASSHTIFVADVPGAGLRAYLARSPHLGCRLRWTGDPAHKSFTNSPNVSFEDPCGGSVFALDGSCVGGPSPRALDGYPVEVVDHTARIDVAHLVRGARRGAVPIPA
jgi:Rieske Fe-S protein